MLVRIFAPSLTGRDGFLYLALAMNCQAIFHEVPPGQTTLACLLAVLLKLALWEPAGTQ
jgi:hypothetical protein